VHDLAGLGVARRVAVDRLRLREEAQDAARHPGIHPQVLHRR
jgi:hypothetical protein